MIYLRLFWEFFKTGLFAVGGGLATLPFIYDISDRTGWFTYQQIADMIAVSESTPGPIGVNTATYVGYITGGLPGAIVATLGLELFVQNLNAGHIGMSLAPLLVDVPTAPVRNLRRGDVERNIVLPKGDCIGLVVLDCISTNHYVSSFLFGTLSFPVTI